MWITDSDVPHKKVVIDLEWLGNSLSPSKTQVTQIAALDVDSQQYFNVMIQPLASKDAEIRGKSKMSSKYELGGVSLKEGLTQFVMWLQNVQTSSDPQSAATTGASRDPLLLIAHNGIRHDGPVLSCAFAKCGLVLPPHTYMVDSLCHARYQLRRHKDVNDYSLAGLQMHYNITLDTHDKHHDAKYDVQLLHHILVALVADKQCGYVTGYCHPMPGVSCMVVAGIGPVICNALQFDNLEELCLAILAKYNSLNVESCQSFLNKKLLKTAFPKVNLSLISSNIEPAAKRYLQYIG